MRGSKEKDITQKALEMYNDVFADIINVLLFNGESVVTEDSLTDVLQESILKIDGRIRAQYRDIAKYWYNSKIKLSMFGLENQTKPEKLYLDMTEQSMSNRPKKRITKKYFIL